MRRLPIRIAQYRNWRCAGLVVGGKQHAAGIGSDAEGGKIIAGNIFSTLRFGGAGAAANAHRALPRLHGCQLFELGRGVDEMAVEFVGKQIEVSVV